MKWVTKRFINEYDRVIDLEIAVDGAGPGDIRITMLSPDICDEGFFTLHEAAQLRDALIEALA